MLKIYNTLTKQKEEFKPINPPNVTMYTCGPTVYDYFHIGNARSFIMADMLRRYLEYKGYKVKYVMNITDVDDKIIKKSGEEKRSFNEVSAKYTTAFLEDIAKLKVKEADVHPKATEHMQNIIDMIKKLEEKGYAYNVDGNVFYNVGKFKGYGKLSGKKTEELEVGARVEENKEKKNPLDFALWKKAKEGEPSWDSPWGKGRPGWHIECSAMSCKHLGETFDIHAGGNDLIFPHHENEIAQSEAATGKKFVNYWIHFGFLNINNEKMSKSLGNFSTARDILKHYSAEAIRLLYAQTHYRGPLNFSPELLSSAETGLERIKNLKDKVVSELNRENNSGVNPEINFDKYYTDFESAMDDDLNSPQAVAVIFDFVKDVNRITAENENLSKEFYKKVKEFLSKTAEAVLGVIDFSSEEELILPEEIIKKLSLFAGETGRESFDESKNNLAGYIVNFLIEERLKARKNKNFSLSDKIRDELKNYGIILQDSKEGTTYKIVKN